MIYTDYLVLPFRRKHKKSHAGAWLFLAEMDAIDNVYSLSLYDFLLDEGAI